MLVSHDYADTGMTQYYDDAGVLRYECDDTPVEIATPTRATARVTAYDPERPAIEQHSDAVLAMMVRCAMRTLTRAEATQRELERAYAMHVRATDEQLRRTVRRESTQRELEREQHAARARAALLCSRRTEAPCAWCEPIVAGHSHGICEACRAKYFPETL